MNLSDAVKKSVVTYAVGFLSSVALTIAAYLIVVHDLYKDTWSPFITAIIISILASMQLVVQLIFFLHLGDESRPRWKLLSFIFAFIILGIIVFGSLWIMFDLNTRMMMSTEDMIKYMNRQTGL